MKVKTAAELKSFLLKPSVMLIIRGLDHVLTWTEYGDDKRASVHVFLNNQFQFFGFFLFVRRQTRYLLDYLFIYFVLTKIAFSLAQ